MIKLVVILIPHRGGAFPTPVSITTKRRLRLIVPRETPVTSTVTMIINNRLPRLSPSSDSGVVYIVKRGSAYKIGFSRSSVVRRVRDAEGELILTIPTGQRPSQLEYAINRRFINKRLPDSELWGREWFALDDNDLLWLRGLAAHLTS